MAEDQIFHGGDVNAVLRLVKQLTGSTSNIGNVQLTLLAIALVTGCKSCGVEKDVALERLEEIFNDHWDDEIVPLDEKLKD